MFHTFSDDALGTHDGVGLADALRNKTISKHEVWQATHVRAKQAQPTLNAITEFIHPQSDIGSSLSGPFAGVPTVIKDSDDIAGYPTRLGSRATHNGAKVQNSKFINQLISSGLTPFAKTTMPELGLTATTESSLSGATRNPWNLNYTAGGSSGGSAALVAAGVVPIGHTNDGGGSTRIPAACCGLYGIKPTRGRLVPMDNIEKMPLSLVEQGIVTRSVRDIDCFMQASEQYFHNASLPSLAHHQANPNRRLRIGVITKGPDSVQCGCSALAAVNQTRQLLEDMGHTTEEFRYPVSNKFIFDFVLYWSFLAFSLGQLGSITLERPYSRKKIEPFTRDLSKHFVRNSHRFPFAVRNLKKIGETLRQVTAQYDFILSPTIGHEPPKLNYISPDQSFDDLYERLKRFVPYTVPQNISGLPSMNIPIGFSPSGLPIGAQITAPFGRDANLIDLAYRLEQAYPFTRIDQFQVQKTVLSPAENPLSAQEFA